MQRRTNVLLVLIDSALSKLLLLAGFLVSVTGTLVDGLLTSESIGGSFVG